MITTPLRPLRPLTHSAYRGVLDDPARMESLPGDVRAHVAALIERRNTAADEVDVDSIDAELVRALCWYAVRPDEIARDVLRLHRWSTRHPLTVDQATVVIAAIAEAGYPLGCNGAPEYSALSGAARDAAVWGCARYWADLAARGITYVSLGDSRGYMPRIVQYDTPGGMHPMQRSALTLGPADDSHGAPGMRRHTRLLLRVS